MTSEDLSEAQHERIARALETVAFGKLLGLKLESIKPGEATLSLEIRDDFMQNNGVVHGGVIASLIDSATAFSIIPLLEKDERITTVDLNINYLRPLVSGTIKARARVLREGGRVIVTSADVFDPVGNLASTALSTYLRFVPGLSTRHKIS
jgi:uncharacterized protein (TIGR00369 family)